jgi:Zn-dependent protease
MGQSEWKSSYDDDGDRFAGVKKVLARIFGDGENPLAWGFPLFKIAGTQYKIHLLMVLYLLGQLIFTLPGHKAGAVFMVPMLVALLVLVLLHEMAHTFVARRNVGQAELRMLWPLGGLEPAQFDDPSPMGELRTALAGVAMHLALIPVFLIPLVVLTGGWDAVMFHPLRPSSSIHTLVLASDLSTPWWLVVIWAFHVVNSILLVINLVPMLPLDGSSVLRLWIARSKGDIAARHQTAFIGLWVATGVGIIGILFQDAVILLVIAIACGIVGTLERRRLQFLSYADMIPGYTSASRDEPEITPAEPDTPDQAELDRVLEKISTSGIQSLSRGERRTLKKATESSRNSEGNR